MSCMGYDGLIWWRALIESVPPAGWILIGLVCVLALIGLACMVSFIWDMVTGRSP